MGLLVPIAASEEGRPHQHLGDHGDGAGDGRHDGAGEDIAVLDVAHLVAEDATQFALGQEALDTRGDGDHGVLRVAASRECVRRFVVDDEDARHGHAGELGNLADEAVEARVIGFRDLPRPRHAECELIAEPVGAEVHDAGENEEDNGATGAADEATHGDQEARQGRQEHCGLKKIHGSRVGYLLWCFPV